MNLDVKADCARATDDFHRLYYESVVWTDTRWLGVRVQKCPLDLWVYQEILAEKRPDVIVECGTRFGGSALFMATVCDRIGHGRIISIDLFDLRDGLAHPRIEFRSLVDSSVTFASYAALDISKHWVRELAREFRDYKNVSFLIGDAAEADSLFTGRRFDVIVSMLTWKHLYPDFKAAARACRPLLAVNGRLIFDLPETNVAWPAPPNVSSGVFEETGTFTRTYTRREVKALLDGAGLSVVAFDEIEHAPGKRRLLVVTRRLPRSTD